MVDLVVVSEAALVVFLFARAIWGRLGGYPEAWYRINHTPYFRHNHIQPDGTPTSVISPVSIIKTNSPAMFSWNKKMWLAGKDVHTTRYNGRPQWYYNPDDMNPIPMRDWANPKPTDPTLIDSAFDNHAIEEMHRYGEKRSQLTFLLIVGFAAVVIIALISAYYSYNAYCALGKCEGGVGFHG